MVVAFVLVILLAALTSYYWRKTQRLEYKYQKLVQSSTKDGTTRFAEAPSCGLSEDEEEDDDDEINSHYGNGSDKQSILGKLRIKKVVLISSLGCDEIYRLVGMSQVHLFAAQWQIDFRQWI